MPNKLALIGIRYDENSSFTKGAADAPPQIRAALRSDAWNLTSETEPTCPTIRCSSTPVISNSRRQRHVHADRELAAHVDRRRTVADFAWRRSFDHLPIVRAFARKYKDLSILHFDAHPDLYDNFQGNRNSHASPFARIMEQKLVKRLVQVGIRTFNAHQREQVKKFGVETIEMHQLRDNLQLVFDSPVYISFDIDALDPAFAPGVSHREPGGCPRARRST